MFKLSVEQIARVCHEANRAYAAGQGDHSKSSWEESPEEIRQSAIAGVKYRLQHSDCTSEELHAQWIVFKEQQGWVYGPCIDYEKKTHHCLLPFDQLPEVERVKDKLFASIVTSMAEWVDL